MEPGNILYGALLFAVSIILVLVATAGGLSVGQRDGPVYLASAAELASGNGFVVPFEQPGEDVASSAEVHPVTHYPPGYPALLALGIRLGTSPIEAARVLGATSLGVIVCGIYIFALTRGIRGAMSTSLALFGFLLSFPHSLGPSSELLFGALLVGTLVALSGYSMKPRVCVLAIAAVLAAASTMVRYAGIALVATVIAMALIFGRGRSRSRHVLIAFLVGVAPLAVFLAASPDLGRSYAFHPPGWEFAKILTFTVAQWLIPSVGGPVVTVSLAVLLVVFCFTWLRAPRPSVLAANAEQSWLPDAAAPLIFSIAHIAVLLVTATFLDQQTRPSLRLMYPVGLAVVIAASATASRWGSHGLPRVRHIGLAFIGAALLAGAWRVAGAQQAVESGDLGFASRRFVEAPAVELAVQLAPESEVFSNVPDGLWVAGLEGGESVPEVSDPWSGEANQELREELDVLASSIENGSGAVLFYRQHSRDYLVSERLLVELAPCEVLDDGASVLLVSPHHPNCPHGGHS